MATAKISLTFDPMEFSVVQEALFYYTSQDGWEDSRTQHMKGIAKRMLSEVGAIMPKAEGEARQLALGDTDTDQEVEDREGNDGEAEPDADSSE